jgi:hypothetical protein
VKTVLFICLLLFAAAKSVCAAPDASFTPKPATGTPFRLCFKGYDGEPQMVRSEKLSFEIDTVDFKQPSVFLKLGKRIPNTWFKLGTFTYKVRRNEKTNDQDEVSELTVINVKTGQTAVLVYNTLVDVSGINSPGKPPTK